MNQPIETKPSRRSFLAPYIRGAVRRGVGCLVVLFVFGILFLLMHGPLLRAAGHWLDTGVKPPQKAGIIYVFAGGENERPRYAAELFKQGRAPRVMTAGGLKTDKLVALGIHLTESEVNARVLERHGVPADRIVKIDRSASTWDEINVLRQYMDEHKLGSAILVTSNFHTRRTRLAARAAFRGSSAKLYILSSPYSVTDLDNWWKSEEDLITVSTEFMKYGFYTVNYRFGLNRKHATKHPEAQAHAPQD